MECKKCGSTNTVKNGRTATGQQQYHCRECGVYTVTDDRARARAIKMDIVDKLHRERVSHRWQRQREGAANPRRTRHRDAATVPLRDVRHERQAEPYRVQRQL
jgi:hypothetical protein